jgi:4-hydroxybenzoate polyprenyltransferase
MAVYVAGITLFARDEAGRSRRGTLIVAAAAMALGLVMAAGHVWLPLTEGVTVLATRLPAATWLVLWGVLATSIILRAVVAIADPTPGRVRAAVGNAIMSIITLDAVLVLASCGEPWAIVVLMLLGFFLVGRRLVPPT